MRQEKTTKQFKARAVIARKYWKLANTTKNPQVAILAAQKATAIEGVST